MAQNIAKSPRKYSGNFWQDQQCMSVLSKIDFEGSFFETWNVINKMKNLM